MGKYGEKVAISKPEQERLPGSQTDWHLDFGHPWMDAVIPVKGSASIWSTGLEERVSEALTPRDVSIAFISAAAVPASQTE